MSVKKSVNITRGWPKIAKLAKKRQREEKRQKQSRFKAVVVHVVSEISCQT